MTAADTAFNCDHLAVITAIGEQAQDFLQGQLTCDLRDLAPGQSRLAMHLSLKGRAMVSLRVSRRDDGFDLVTPATKADDVLNGLKKYALFSKVVLAKDEQRQVIGLTAEPDDEAIALGGPGEPRWFRLSTDTAPSAAGTAADWLALDIAAGEAHLYPGGEDLWLPQALNYDLLGGVHFNKGCYLGQEVVARMHFKGQMKQRLRRWQWAGTDAPAVGTVLRNADGKSLGEVVQAVASDGQVQALAVIRLDHAGDLYLDNQALGAQEQPLPYSLPE